jgi:NADH-quinone oxidoreductase subunit C
MMSEKVIEDLRNALGGKIKDLVVKSARRVYVDIAAEDLVDVARCLFSDLRARYAIASGMHLEEGFEVLHHFAFDVEHVMVSVRVRAEGQEPVFDSITPVIEGASFIEREMHDLLGMDFRGHPGLKRLLLSEDWPEGVYPLRRGKPWEGEVEKQI